MDNRQIKLTIDNREITADSGMTILNVARENDIEIPTLCYDPRLPPYGSCLLCVVEVEGINKLLLSCTTEATEGMKVTTNNERIFKARQNALDMLLSNHFADCRGPCYEKCPADVDVQGYLALADQGKHKEALELIRETNPLPLVCGRVCVRYCEGACRRQNVESPVAINFVKRYVADLESDNLDKPVPPKSNGHKVAIVGGGPGGLTAAYFLAKKGYKVKIFDAHPKLGGMLRYGIPDYRLPQEMLEKEIKYITDFGVEVQTEVKLGKDFTLDDLKAQEFEATFLALGAQKAKSMRVKNEDTKGVMGGIYFLDDVKKNGAPDLKGNVVVVGGGNTAVDAARTAIRCNATKVTILYRRTRKEMPADEVEIVDALEEGVEIEYLVAPLEVKAEDGKIKSLHCQKMKLGEPDASGRRRPVPIEGSEYDVVCNYIIAAIGQDCDVSSTKGNKLGDIETTKWNTIITDEKSFATNIEGVFAGGDVVTGPAAAVDAIGAGRKTAMVIDTYIQTGDILPAPTEFISLKTNLGEIPEAYFDQFEKIERSKMIQEDPSSRGNTFDEVDHGISEESMKRETSKCLSCGCSDVFTCELKKYAGEYNSDQKRFDGKVQKFKVDNRHPYISLDPNKCILCGRCVRICDQGQGVTALGFINRGFSMVVRPTMDKPLYETSCIACGNCIEACPTGAISFKQPFEKPGPWRTQPYESICNHCGVGCEIVYNKKDDDIWNITAKKESEFVNGELCVRGRFGHRHILKEMRLTEPMLKGKDGRHTTNLDNAIDKAAAGLKDVLKKHGPEAVGFFISPKATNEETFLFQKMARDIFKTNNIASLYDLERNDSGRDLFKAFGATASTIDRKQVEKADVIVILNSNVTEENPVLGFSIKRAAMNGADLVSISSTEIEINNFAAMWLDARRGTSTTLLKAVTSEILRHKWFDEKAVNKRADGFEEFRKSISTTLDQAAGVAGVAKKKIKDFAKLISNPEKNVVFVYNIDSSLDKSSCDLQALANLMLLTGKIGKARNGIVLTHEHSNYQGHFDLCADADSLRSNKQFAKRGDIKGSKDLYELGAAVKTGKIKGAFIFGENFAINKEYEGWLSKADFVVALDMFETETSTFADVAIPGSAYAESEGCTTSQERKVKAFTRVFEPPIGRTGFEILSEIYAKITGEKAPDIETVRKEIASFNPAYKQIVKLGSNGHFYWNETVEGGRILFESGFMTPNKKAVFLTGAADESPLNRSAHCFSTIDKIDRDIQNRLLSYKNTVTEKSKACK